MTREEILALPEWPEFVKGCALRGMEAYVTGTGQPIAVHPRGTCTGDYCTIHNPSNHHMREWPTHWREDRGIMERICPHGTGHPDPDDLVFLETVGRDAKVESIHGCCGCCTQPQDPATYKGEYLG